MNPEAFQILLGTACASGGCILGFFLCAMLQNGKARDAERRAIRDMEKLFRARTLQDMRDNTRLF